VWLAASTGVRGGASRLPRWEGRVAILTGRGPSEVDLWTASLRQSEEVVAVFAAVLSEDERIRAGRFRFAPDRDRFVVARGLLRALLAAYVGRDPADLRFAHGRYGKPSLVDPAATSLQFNVAHSRDRALFAVGRSREVGVDLEAIRPDLEIEELSRLSLTKREHDLLAKLPPDRRRERFVTLWTRKEALAKAIGLGLALPFDRVDSAESGTPGCHARWDGLVLDGRTWSIRSLDVEPGYAAALAIEGDGAGVCFQAWPNDVCGPPSLTEAISKCLTPCR
jgi:4'-phosphopantetheinyl transferase